MENMNYLNKLKKLNPVIHCITNTVTVNDCANALLAIGARPVMAEHPQEASEITSLAAALLINTGSVTGSKIEAMTNSAAAAKEKNIPFVLDCVGVSSSTMRYELVKTLIKTNTPKVIKGNAAEIAALLTGEMSHSGVDSDGETNEEIASELARRTGAVIAMTGKTDIITDGTRITHIKNGCEMLSCLTGTGCMVGCITAALLTVLNPYDAAKYGAAIMGICGEAAAEDYRGMGTFHIQLMDALSLINDAELAEKIIAD